ncbi:MAG: hypothetical protein ACYC67_08945 [Prosthecobacter sp.]
MTTAFTLTAQQPKKDEPINTVSFRGIVDVVYVKVQIDPKTNEGKLWVEAYVGKPERMAVNSRTYMPKWQGHIAAPWAKWEGKLKPFDDKTIVTVDIKKGRSIVKINEQPSAKNNWTVTIEISDQPVEPDDYNIKINW